MHIRKATSADASLLARVYAASFAAAYARILDEDALEGFTPRRAEERIRRSLKSGARIFAAVHKRDGIVGFISIVSSDGSLLDYSHAIEMHYVSPEFHARGLGRRLLEQACGEIPGKALAIWLPTRLRACGFYEHLGAKKLGTRPTTVEGKALEASAWGLA